MKTPKQNDLPRGPCGLVDLNRIIAPDYGDRRPEDEPGFSEMVEKFTRLRRSDEQIRVVHGQNGYEFADWESYCRVAALSKVGTGITVAREEWVTIVDPDQSRRFPKTLPFQEAEGASGDEPPSENSGSSPTSPGEVEPDDSHGRTLSSDEDDGDENELVTPLSPPVLRSSESEAPICMA